MNTRTNGMSKQGEFAHHGKVSKVERYKWADPSKPGELRYVKKEELNIDYINYQRPPTEEKVNAIAANFSWRVFGALIIGRRPDGSLWVMTGQHRLLASRKRVDITVLPCIIFDLLHVSEEADVFLKEALLRKPMSSQDKFQAFITKKDPAALLVEQLIKESGRRMGRSGASNVACIGLMQRHANKTPDVLKKIWPLVVSISVGEVLHDRILDALMFIENRLQPGVSLLDKYWSKKITDVGVIQLKRAADNAAVMHSGGTGGAGVWAQGIVGRLNQRVSEKKRLVLSSYVPKQLPDSFFQIDDEDLEESRPVPHER